MLYVHCILILLIVCLYGLRNTSPYIARYAPAIIVLALTVVMGLRVNVGRDYEAYVSIYNDSEYYYSLWIEPSWLMFCDFLKAGGFKVRTFFFLTSLLIVYGYYSGFKALSPNIYLSLLLFLVIGLYTETANTVRQCAAQAVLFAGAPNLFSKQWGRWLLYCIIATIMHFSALIGILLMFLCLIRVPQWVLFSFLGVTFFAGEWLMHILSSTTYDFFLMIGKYAYTEDSHEVILSTGLLRYFYNIVGLYILFQYKTLRQATPYMYIIVNLVLMGIFIYNIFYLFLAASRLYRYGFPFIMILLPYTAISFERKSRILIMSCIVLSFLLFTLKSSINMAYDFDVKFF